MKEENRMKIRNILIVVLSIFMLIFIGLGSYAGVVNLFGIEVREDNSSMEKKVIATDILLDRKVCNLIYSVDKKNQEISGVILEFFNADTHKLDYVTVPCNLKLVINNRMIKQLKKYGYEVEKTTSPRKFIQLFGNKDAYQFGQMILEDIFDIKISYYTVFDEDILAKYFVISPGKFYLKKDGKYVKYKYDMYELSESYITKTEQIQNDVAELIEQGYKDLESNFSISNKMYYLKDYEKAQIDLIYNWHLVGEEKYNQFIQDADMNSKLIKYIQNTKTQYKASQEEYNGKLEGK